MPGLGQLSQLFLLCSQHSDRFSPMTIHRLRPPIRDELRDTLDYALRYGRLGHPHRYTSDAMARIAADALVDHLERSGFVALRSPPVPLRCVTTQSREE